MKKLIFPVIIIFFITIIVFASNFSYKITTGNANEPFAVGDIDNDGHMEIVIGPSINGITLVSGNNLGFLGGYIAIIDSLEIGEYKLVFIDTVPSNYGAIKSIAIGDINNDGLNEIIYHSTMLNPENGVIRICSWDGTNINILNELDGSFRSRGHGLKVADLDNDGKNELIVAQDFYGRKIQVYRNITGDSLSLIWEDSGSDVVSVDIGDVNGDGNNNIVVATTNWSWYSIRVYEYSGSDSFSLVWESPGTHYFQDVNLSDITGDGIKDIIAAEAESDPIGDSGGLFVYSYEGGNYEIIDSTNINCLISKCWVSDVNNDSIKEILFLGTPDVGSNTTFTNNYLWIYKLNGTDLIALDSTIIFNRDVWSPKSLQVECYDLDEDNINDIIVGGYLKSLDILNWGGISGINNKSSFKTINSVYNISPNPTVKDIVFSYSVPVSQNLKIEIFNSIGERVNELVNEYKSKGNYSIYWDCRDFYGNKVPAGIYWIRIRGESIETSKKMIKVK